MWNSQSTQGTNLATPGGRAQDWQHTESKMGTTTPQSFFLFRHGFCTITVFKWLNLQWQSLTSSVGTIFNHIRLIYDYFCHKNMLISIFLVVLLINTSLIGYFISPDGTKPSEQTVQRGVQTVAQQSLLVVKKHRSNTSFDVIFISLYCNMFVSLLKQL